MHAKPSDKLVMMANQIANNLEIQGPDRAIAEMSSHIRRYWEPRMRETILTYVREDGSALNPLALKSLQAIWPDSMSAENLQITEDGEPLIQSYASNYSQVTFRRLDATGDVGVVRTLGQPGPQAGIPRSCARTAKASGARQLSGTRIRSTAWR